MPSSLSLRPPSPEVMTSRHFQVSWDTKSLQYVWSLETLHIGSLAAALLWDTLNDQTDAYFSSLYSFSFTHTSWVSVGLVINNQINNFSFMLRPLWCLIKKSKQLLLVAVHFKLTHFCNNTASFSYCTTFSRVATMLLLVLQVTTCNTSNNILHDGYNYVLLDVVQLYDGWIKRRKNLSSMPFSSCIHALQSADSGPCAGKRKKMEWFTTFQECRYGHFL